LKVKFVSVEEGVSALGFRRVAAIARVLFPATEIYFLPVGNLYSISKHINPSSESGLSDDQIDRIAREFADADLVAFSSMTPSAEWVEKIAGAIKHINPEVFILWGGSHCILSPEEAIRHVDAICTGEGEAAFKSFFMAFAAGDDFHGTRSMWFRDGDVIKRNTNAPLNSTADLETFPHPFNDFSCQIYDPRYQGFRQYTPQDYVQYNGLSYKTIWTLGCPFSCSYCANDAFIAIDKCYRKIRYPSVDHLIKELEEAVKSHPFVCTVVFYDDNFIAIPLETLRYFCEQYRRCIGLPFVVFGLHPNLISEEKIDLLGKAGMNRGRMGIQSGSERILAFYDRRTSLTRVAKSASILAKAARKYKMIPPAYDVISDNPLSTREDEINTLKFFYNLERPYTLTVFSLRAFPQTRLWKLLQDHSMPELYETNSLYLETRASMVNVLLYMLGIGKPPQWLFSRFLHSVRGYQEEQKWYPGLNLLFRFLLLFTRAIQHLRVLDFTTITGGVGVYYLWKFGIVRPRIAK